MFKVNPKLGGWLGTKVAERRADEAAQARTAARQDALSTRDPDKALAVLEGMTEAESEAQHQTAWSEALATYQALDDNPMTKPIVAGLAGRDYGKLANNNGTFAALLYKADLAEGVIKALPEWEKAIRADIEKKLRPVLEREARARAMGEEPSPDLGSGAASGNGHKRFTRDDIKRMSPAEYERNADEIDRQMASRRRAS